MERWGWLIITYLFLGGLGAGAYIASFAAERGYLGNVPGIRKAGYYLAAPVVAIGCILLMFDLTPQIWSNPGLLFGLLSSSSSWITWGTYILTGFIIVGAVAAYLAWRQTDVPLWLGLIGVVLALGTAAYTGFLLAVVKAVPFWNTNLMPVLFIVSALSTGLSAASLLGDYLEKSATVEAKVHKTHSWLIVAEVILLVVFMGVALAGVKGPVAAMSASKMVSGSLAAAFWSGLVIVGLVGPWFFFNKKHDAGRKEDWSRYLYASDIGVLIGGLALRSVIVFAALPIWLKTVGQ